jgi:hypothetical protein
MGTFLKSSELLVIETFLDIPLYVNTPHKKISPEYLSLICVCPFRYPLRCVLDCDVNRRLLK